MKVKPFCRHKTEEANNHIEQGDALIFARNPIGVTYNQLAAMLTRTLHKSPLQKMTFNIRNRPDGTERTLNAMEKCIVTRSICYRLKHHDFSNDGVVFRATHMPQVEAHKNRNL
jgi:hypothetical protein